MSTGVIGQRLNIDKMVAAIPTLHASLGDSWEDGHRAAVAITTTDLVSKSCALQLDLNGTPVTLCGMCKGNQKQKTNKTETKKAHSLDFVRLRDLPPPNSLMQP